MVQDAQSVGPQNLKDRSRYKCLICKSCTVWSLIGPHRFVYCSFCRQYFKMLPKGKLETVTKEHVSELFMSYHKELG